MRGVGELRRAEQVEVVLRVALLCREAGRVVRRERIMHDVWDTAWLGSTKTLDTHILALRNKLGAEAITTLRNVGYRLDLQ